MISDFGNYLQREKKISHRYLHLPNHMNYLHLFHTSSLFYVHKILEANVDVLD